MSYITAVTNRTQADIVAQNSKAYFNYTDWNRIYNNARLMIDVANLLNGKSYSWSNLAEAAMSTIPNVTDFNTMLQKIELARADVGLTTTPTAIKYNWVAGVGEPSPKFTDVNLWESVIDLLWTHFSGAAVTVCPTLSSDLTITTGNQGVYIDCIDAVNFNIDLQGSANLYII